MARSLRLWFATIALVTAMLLPGVVGPNVASAAPVPSTVGLHSCGRDTNADTPQDTYCSWDGSGTSPTIGDNSCTEVDSCTNLGDGVTIGSGSCTADHACYGAGGAGLGGSASIGDQSCTGVESCEYAGGSGSSSIGSQSCTGFDACTEVGSGGSSVIGTFSCRAELSCLFSGSSSGGDPGESEIGDRSCNAYEACDTTGAKGGVNTIGHDSCNGDWSCVNAGYEGNSTIGNFSCNEPSLNYPECAAATANIGDCMNNDITPAECASSLLRLRKYLLPFWDSGRFDLRVDGNIVAANVGNNGTGTMAVAPGLHTISETATGNTSLSSYRTTVICVDAGGFLAYGFSTSLTFQVPATQVTCTFINQRTFSWFWWR